MQRPGSDVDPAGTSPQTGRGIVRPCQVDQDWSQCRYCSSWSPVVPTVATTCEPLRTSPRTAAASRCPAAVECRRRPPRGRRRSGGRTSRTSGHRPGVAEGTFRQPRRRRGSRGCGGRWRHRRPTRTRGRCSPERAQDRGSSRTGPSAGRSGVPVYAAAKYGSQTVRHRRRDLLGVGRPRRPTIEKSSTPYSPGPRSRCAEVVVVAVGVERVSPKPLRPPRSAGSRAPR